MTRDELVARAHHKPVAPFFLDERLTWFCPQENLEALDLEVVRAAHAEQLEQAAAPRTGEPAVLLLLPCQATKPYPLSSEHQAVNRALLATGWAPEGRGDWPAELAAHVDDVRLLANTPLRRGGWRLDRATISEPFGAVPYADVYAWHGVPSPFSRYDDPGLFEHRGIEPTWRADCTAHGGRWGDRERAAFVAVHERLVDHLTAVLTAAAPRYAAILAYVAPGLTHRSFLGDDAERRAVGLPRARTVDGRQAHLYGVGDLAPGLVRLVPDGEELIGLRRAHGGRLPTDVLAERPALALLTGHLDAVTAQGAAWAA
jgi:hypothetical protein